jgi:hypothetical protein
LTQTGEKVSEEEKFAEIHWLTSLFVSMYERYYCRPHHKEVRFIPTTLKGMHQGQEILNLVQEELKEDPGHFLHQALAAHFIDSLQKRLES